MTGLRVIWKSAANKFYIILFVFLSAMSLLLLLRIRLELYLLLSTLLFGGVILFLLLAVLALIPQFNKVLRPVERSNTTRLALFLVTILLAILSYLLPFRIDYMLAYCGFLLWLVVQALLSCSLAHSLSNMLSDRRPRVLGWIFLALAFTVEALVYLWARRFPIIYPLFLFYTIAWFAPCIMLAFTSYRNARSFSAYCLIALIYTLFPVAYRIYSLLDDIAIRLGNPPTFMARFPIDEIITIMFFIWALNGIGRFFAQRYETIRAGKQRLVSKLRDSPYEQQKQPQDDTRTDDSTDCGDGSRLNKEPMLDHFLIFGLLFSALAYFVFVHAALPLGIPDYIESRTAYTFSILATIPLLFYIALRKKKTP